MTAYEQKHWSLVDLFPECDSREIHQAFVQLESFAQAFEIHREHLSENIQTSSFLGILAELEELMKKMYRLHSFAELSFAADTQDQAAQAFFAQVQQTSAEIENRTVFFSLWWKQLDATKADHLMAESGDYRFWLEQMRLFKPHTLSEPEEKVVNLKNTTGANALHTLYESITNRYLFTLMVDGEPKEVTRDELMVFTRSHDPELRKAAYQELYRVFGEDGPILGQIYQTLVRDWRNEQVSLRGFLSPIATRNLINHIPDPVISTLLDVAKQNTLLFQRFFRLKASCLGVECLQRYDIYAPVAKAERGYSFDDGASLVFSAFREFDPRLEELARRVFDEDHLDSAVRKGKHSGAFCSTVTPDLTPWVLVNYQGRAADVATLAHELGHAIHSMLAEHHSLFTQHSSLPLAETASTFGEMMLIDRLLMQEAEPAVRQDLLFRQLDGAYATIMRQSFFALFEIQAHTMVAQGATVDELAEAYLENLKIQFGQTIDVGHEFRWEWVSIPHIYSVPFYVYAYAFGQLLVFALYRQYKAEGETFKPRYLKILSAGGSEAPGKLLSEAGIDVFEASFWQGGFDVICELLDQLEVLTAQ